MKIKYFEIIDVIRLVSIKSNDYEKKERIVVSWYDSDDRRYDSRIESRRK